MELRRLRLTHPELAPAVDLQLELLEIQRRVLPRISLPAALLDSSGPVDPARGRPLLTWSLVPIEWSEFRAVLRETTDALLRTANIEPDDASFLTAMARDGNRLPAFIEAWFRDRVENDSTSINESASADLARASEGAFESALSLAFRPFLVRCADAVGPRLSVDRWQLGRCPLCYGDPELAVLSDSLDRMLVCGRCSLRWPFPDHRCTFCENTDSDRLQSFASQDRIYRIFACDACHRYLKAYDERAATRPAIPSVDLIAMLPFDALAIQRGYSS
jgi:formate dehydrogenase maturation protein FdhE